MQNIDGAMIVGPLRGEKNGKNSTDREVGQRALAANRPPGLVDAAVADANVHGKRLFEEAIENTLEMALSGRADAQEVERHLCLVKR